jgi:hypothetical protein
MHGRTRRILLLVAAILASAPGCSRKHFRQRADKDVEGIITQKNVFPDWEVRNWHVYPDPRARFADPSNPDRPPYPPDDYAARMLSPNPQKPGHRSGTGRYEGDGYMRYLEQWDAENRAAQQPAPAVPWKNGEKLPAPKPPAGQGASATWQQWQIAAALRSDTPMGPPTRDMLAGRGSDGFRLPNAEHPSLARPANEIVVVSGEIPDGNKMVPAIVAIPVIPDAAQAQPDGVPAVVATGDAAASFLRALDTKETNYRIRQEQAIELGLMNSREFQDRREDLYLAALPVSLNRFSFAAQGFFTELAATNWAGGALGRSPQDSALMNTQMGFSKLFSTGGLLLVKLANSVVVDLTGDKPTTTLSNFSLNLAQPFLQGGGRAVTLEPLTLSERNMLYAIRSYARFRKLFYVAISAGGGITNNPYSLQGLSQNLGRGIGGNLTAPSVGYLPILLQAAVIANQKRNIESLENLLKLYQAFREGGQQSDLQVSQVEQQLLTSRNQLLGSGQAAVNSGGGQGQGIRGYLDTVDNFKLQLGLPLTVGLELDQTPLQPIRDQLGRFEAVYAQVKEAEAQARRYDPSVGANQSRARTRQILTESPLVRGTPFARNIAARWAVWEKRTNDELVKRLASLAEERRKLLDSKADRVLKNLPEPADEAKNLEDLETELELGAFERALRGYEAQPWAKETGVARATIQAAAFRDVVNSLFQLILEARNDRLDSIRKLWPDLPSVTVDGTNLLEATLDEAMTTAMQTALSQRLDLMNSRAQVVDAWRQIKVQANSLQGVFDVQYNLGSVTPSGGANPVAFSGARTDHTLTFTGELPLVRRAERNNYRAALIGYQRQRRTLQAFEDNIANDVRADVRELRTIAELYRVQQRLIEIGYFQVDNAEALLLQPPAPGAQTDAGSAAALTRQVLDAQSSLLQSQNQMYGLWVSYLSSRMALYLDLELMQIDERGVWSNESLPANEAAVGPAPGPRERLPAPRPFPGVGR